MSLTERFESSAPSVRWTMKPSSLYIQQPLGRALFNGALSVPRYLALEKMQSTAMFCVIELRDAPPKSPIIGFASFDRAGEPRDQDLSYVIALLPDIWNKGGYGTEVTRFVVDHTFDSLNAHRASLGAFSENERAAAVNKKLSMLHKYITYCLGLVEEARQRNARYTNGAWRDRF